MHVAYIVTPPQVLMAKSAGMSLYNNNRFEQSYITFKAEAETLRTMCDQTIKNPTSMFKGMRKCQHFAGLAYWAC